MSERGLRVNALTKIRYVLYKATHGETLVSESVYAQVTGTYPNAEKRVLTVKGRTEPVTRSP